MTDWITNIPWYLWVALGCFCGCLLVVWSAAKAGSDADDDLEKMYKPSSRENFYRRRP